MDILEEYDRQVAALPSVKAEALLDKKSLLVIVDMVGGFLTEGNLASPRAARALPAVERLLTFARDNGVPAVAFADCHAPDCIEFETFPPHCVRGTQESQVVPSLCAIGGYTLIEKNSTNGFLTSEFQALIEKSEAARTVVCGVCTDICVLQFALTLKTYCNQHDRPMEVVLPVDATETYDAPGHDAHFMKTAALQILQQAGITLIQEARYDG